METRATLRGVRLSVDKGRLVADLIRGKKVDQALNILQFTQKKAAGIIKKVLESAIANRNFPLSKKFPIRAIAFDPFIMLMTSFPEASKHFGPGL